MGKLDGKKVLVTGASRGIGAGIAKALASEGATIAITFASREEAAQAVLKDLPGDGHACFRMNISDEDSISEAVKGVFEKFGNLDGLVNNAGITRDQLMLRMKTAEFDEVINTNLRGTYLCSKAVLKPMVKARAGSIVNITSVIGQMGNAGQANYAASKAGVEAFSKSLAKEVGSRGIRVNCVAPGFITTEMTDALSDDQKEAIIGQLAINRLGKVEDIANAVSFLLSDDSSYVTGETISVNGGLYM